MSILSEKESIKFKNFMDLVKRNVPEDENLESLHNIYAKLIKKKNEMNNELNTSHMTPNEKITFETYFAELHKMIKCFYYHHKPLSKIRENFHLYSKNQS